MTEQCHDRGPHAWEDVVIANTLVLGGEFVGGAAIGYWCVEWGGPPITRFSTAWFGSKYRAGIAFLKELGFYVTIEGKMERCP